MPLKEQRKLWNKEFWKTYAVLVVVYAGYYLLRTNFKSAQPFLQEQLGMTTTQLGTIGFGFSLTYGFGGLMLGFLCDGKNTKRILSMLLGASAVISIAIGVLLMISDNYYGILLVLWTLNGLAQSAGGPLCNSTMNRWTSRKTRGSYIGAWNASHNLGAMLAGVLALWGANTFFGGSVVGMFIFPAIISLGLAVWGMFFGKDDPAELGWNTPEEVYEESIPKHDILSSNESSLTILKKYILKNPAIWFLCIANVAAYITRIGIDNWNVMYTKNVLGFSDYVAINSTSALEIGGLIGSLTWGLVSDKLGGRRSLTAFVGMALVIIPVQIYSHATNEIVVYIMLFLIGFLIFGPVILIGISVIGFAPKKATVVANAVPRAFGYIFGDSAAKILLGRVADPTKKGIFILGREFHGWNDTFMIITIAAVIGTICLIIVALFEEKMIRADKEFSQNNIAE